MSEVVRRLTLADVPACLDLCVDRGWPREDAKWRLFLEAGRGFGLEDDGRLVGTVIMIPYGEALAFVAMMLVARDHAGRGVGRRLLEGAIAEGAAPDATLMLYATEEGRPLYARVGFSVAGQVVRHVGRLSAAADPRAPAATAADVDAMLALDRAAFGAPRDAMLRHLIATAERAVVAPGGFGVAWQNLTTRMIGPVVAGDEATARSIVATLAEGAAEARVDVPSAQPGLGAWLVAHGLVAEAPAPLMIRGGPVPGRRELAWAIASRGLG